MIWVTSFSAQLTMFVVHHSWSFWREKSQVINQSLRKFWKILHNFLLQGALVRKKQKKIIPLMSHFVTFLDYA